jgi:uncharacterized repeat protein (TIGR02543 family)
MNTKKVFVYGLLAVILALSLAGCPSPEPEPEPVPGPIGPATITYTAEQTGGANNTTTSAGIVFTFSASVDSLNAADIIVGGVASKGSATLSGSGTSWTLSTITVNNAGIANVSINKEGIETATKTVTVHKQGQVTPTEYRTIVWNFNGGTPGAGAQYPTQIAKDAVLAQPSPNPTKANSTFGGWYTNPGLTTPYNFANPVTENLSLYAKWEAGSQPPVEPPAEITVTAGSTLAEKLSWVSSRSYGNNIYIIKVDNDESSGNESGSFTVGLTNTGERRNITIRIEGNGGEKIISGDLWVSNVTLVLDRNITLHGRVRITRGGLINVDAVSTLIMNAGSKITGNTSYEFEGGGVNVGEDTIFTMNGGEISDNSAVMGGGVYVSDGAIFTMNGGEISGNTSYSISTSSRHGGGGVFVEGGQGGVYYPGPGTFIMNGGKISDNTADSYGGGVYINRYEDAFWRKYYADFTMNDGEISGNSAVMGGGGVYVGEGASDSNPITKSGGTIYGYNASDMSNSNVVKDDSGEAVSDRGHAVYVNSSKRRETTAGPEVNLDSSKSGAEGGWEN